MNGTLFVEVALVAREARVVHLSCCAPLSAKVLDGRSGPSLMLIGSAAGLLEGDGVAIDLCLHPGTSLTVGSAAATLAHPCPRGGWTAASVSARVGAGARLAWLPEPLVACAGGRHRGRAALTLERGAVAVWSDAVTLGRSGERAGLVDLRLDATLDGEPLLRDGLCLGAGSGAGPADDLAASPAVLDAARHTGSVCLLGRRPTPAALGDLELAGPGAVVRAVAPSAALLRRRLEPAAARFLGMVWPVAGSPHGSHRAEPEVAPEKEELVHG